MTRTGAQGWHKQIRREGMCDRTCYHLVLGLEGVALYSVVSALPAHTHRERRTPFGWLLRSRRSVGEVAVKAISSWEKGLLIFVRQSIWDDWGQMGKTMKFSNVLIHCNCVFGNLSLESFCDVFPLFLRDFTLIMVDKQQGFPVDGGVSNVACAYRHNVLCCQ